MKASIEFQLPDDGVYIGTFQVNSAKVTTRDGKTWIFRTEDSIKSPDIFPCVVIVTSNPTTGRCYKVELAK